MGFEGYQRLWEIELFWHKMSKKVKRNIFCVGSMLSSLYFQTTILAQNTYGFSQKVVLISIHTNTSAFYFHGFLIYFFLYFLLSLFHLCTTSHLLLPWPRLMLFIHFNQHLQWSYFNFSLLPYFLILYYFLSPFLVFIFNVNEQVIHLRKELAIVFSHTLL